MKVISAEQVHAALNYPALVDALGEAYAGSFKMPPRQVFLLDDDEANHDALAVLPSWGEAFIAVKAFTYFPEAEAPYKSLYSNIMLFDRTHGEPLAMVDGTSVTFWRTAGISALATRLLAREDSKTMLLLGTGNLASYLIRANASVRPLKKIMVWGRDHAKAEAVCQASRVELPAIEIVAVDDREAACAESDIVVSATGSHEPLVLGDWIQPGTHTDFIGNHHASKRECDTALVKKSKVYVDSYVNAMKEAGEILLPISEGVFRQEAIVAELSEMCKGSAPLRRSDDEITMFKSIGMALSDLVGAGMVYQATDVK
jgi:1-pyrroline-2-carboxylate reductase [NAD(P)H]